MVRVRFELSLANAIRHVSLGSERRGPPAVSETPAPPAAVPSGPPPIRRIARLLLAPFRRPARFIRGFLVGAIEKRIDQAQAGIDSANSALTKATGDIDTLHAKLAELEIELNNKLDELARRMRDIKPS